MKKLLILFNILICANLISMAQPRGEGRGLRMTTEERATAQTEHMTEKLQLDEQTVALVQEINLDFAKKRESLRETVSRGPEMREQMLALRNERLEALEGILSEEQMKTLKELESQNESRRKRGRRGSGSN